MNKYQMTNHMNIDIPLSNLFGEMIKLKNIGRMVTCQRLGFYRIFIKPKDEVSPSLMLHAWLHENQPKQGSENEIHSHIFDMTSRIISGELVNEIYDVVDIPIGPPKLVRFCHSGKIVRLVTDDLVSPRLISSEIVREGEKYSFKSRIFHRTKIREFPTVTLMEKNNMINEDAVNIIRADFQANEAGEYTEPEINQEEIWSAILDILKSKIEVQKLKATS